MYAWRRGEAGQGLGADVPRSRAFPRWVAAYFQGPGGSTPLLLSLGIALAVVLQVLIQLRINLWQAAFFDALELRSAHDILVQTGAFAVLAAASTAIAVMQLSFTMRLQLGWRRWLSAVIVGRWLAEARHYQLGFLPGDHTNPDQRIADDVRIVCEAIVDFGAGILNALLMLACFVGVLWNLSGSVVVPIAGGVRVEGYMVWAALIYAAIGTTLATWIGRPLPGLSAAKLAAEGEYRSNLVRARENSEGIALMRGERDERLILSALFDTLADRWNRLRRGTCRVAWLTNGYALTGLIFPTLVASPLYLAGHMSLGGLMQAVAAMMHVQSALSWTVTNFARIADVRASVIRTTALMDALDDIDLDLATPAAEQVMISHGDGEELRLDGLDIGYPDGSVFISRVTATFRPGEKVLIVGESGVGKSTLLRAIAGIWPWGRGSITWPRDASVMFMPQRPYFPTGTLAAALAYPLDLDAFPEDACRTALERCGLGPLLARLHETDRWDQVLSGGDQQRLAFARVLLHRPRWVFLDEATASLDEEAQADLMRVFREELATTAVVSASDRPGLEKLHDRTMTLVRGGESARLVRGLRSRHGPQDRDTPPGAGETDRPPILARLRRMIAGD